MNNPPDNVSPLIGQPDTINPYRTAARMMASRLVWDLYPQSWKSRSRLRSYRNIHEGDKAVILCNGPSLLKVDFNLLIGVCTFGLNKINLLFDRTEFRPSYIAAVNPFVIRQNAEFYNHTGIPLFLDSYGARKQLVALRSNVCFLHSGPQGFARDCAVSVFQGYTVTYVAMQLAFHMGFTKVALVGCDHSFAMPGPANKTVSSGEKDTDHFDPNYFSGGLKWQLPDLFESEVAYTRAKNMYEAFGRKIVNATEGGKLEVFQRLTLPDFLASDS